MGCTGGCGDHCGTGGGGGSLSRAKTYAVAAFVVWGASVAGTVADVAVPVAAAVLETVAIATPSAAAAGVLGWAGWRWRERRREAPAVAAFYAEQAEQDRARAQLAVGAGGRARSVAVSPTRRPLALEAAPPVVESPRVVRAHADRLR